MTYIKVQHDTVQGVTRVLAFAAWFQSIASLSGRLGYVARPAKRDTSPHSFASRGLSTVSCSSVNSRFNGRLPVASPSCARRPRWVDAAD